LFWRPELQPYERFGKNPHKPLWCGESNPYSILLNSYLSTG
jgi:hypothetical protein